MSQNQTSTIVQPGAYNPGNGLHVTSGYPYRDNLVNSHNGVDWSKDGGSAGTSINAAMDGVVTISGGGSGSGGTGYGKWVVIESTLADGTKVKNIYGHVVGEVAVGATVKAGAKIGHIGSVAELQSGWSQSDIANHKCLGENFTGPHLHNQIEIKDPNGKKFVVSDPLAFSYTVKKNADGIIENTRERTRDIYGNVIVKQTEFGLDGKTVIGKTITAKSKDGNITYSEVVDGSGKTLCTDKTVTDAEGERHRGHDIGVRSCFLHQSELMQETRPDPEFADPEFASPRVLMFRIFTLAQIIHNYY